MKNNSHVTLYLYDVGAWTWAIKLILLHSHHHNDDNGNFSHHWACVGEFCDIFQVIIRDIDWDVIHNTTHNKQEREREKSILSLSSSSSEQNRLYFLFFSYECILKGKHRLNLRFMVRIFAAAIIQNIF